MDRSLVTLERMRSFVRVAERESFSAVAREQGIGQSTVTRHVGELERALGVSLLNRTTRQVTLTDEGAHYLAEARTILRRVDEVTDEARSAGGRPVGTVRVSCTAALGVRHVARGLFALQDRYPDIRIDLGLSDVRIDLVREGVDIAVRLGPLTDSAMQLKRIGVSHRVLVASQAYLARCGRPIAPHELTQHQTIRMSNVIGSDTLSFQEAEGETRSIRLKGNIIVDHGLVAREAVVQGRGLAACHIWLVDDLLRDGRLEQVLPELKLEPVPLSILFVPARARIARVRLVIDALATFLGEIPGIEPGTRHGSHRHNPAV